MRVCCSIAGQRVDSRYFWRIRAAPSGRAAMPEHGRSRKELPRPARSRSPPPAANSRKKTGVLPHGPFLPLGTIRQKAGKVVHGWAWEGDADPAKVISNTMQTEWPKGSGRWITFPEVDRCAWFEPRAAREKINPAQVEFIDRLEAALYPPKPAA